MPSSLDKPEGRAWPQFTAVQSLEHTALKGLATSRTVGVNAAPFPLKTKAWLGKGKLPTLTFQLKPQRSKELWVFPLLQLDITEEDPVTAQPASRA